MDGRKNNGGKRQNSGRKSKEEHQRIAETLNPLESKALKALKEGLDDGQSWAVKLWFEYMYGKPRQAMEIESTNNYVTPVTISIE